MVDDRGSKLYGAQGGTTAGTIVTEGGCMAGVAEAAGVSLVDEVLEVLEVPIIPVR